MKVLILTALLALVGTALAASPIWVACKGVSGKVTVTNVEVSGCDAPPCHIKKGINATVIVDYTLDDDLDVVYNQVFGHIGIDVPFPGFPADEKSACKVGMTCPGKKGDKNTEKLSLPISASYPSIKVTAKWKLTSDEAGNKEEACFEVELQFDLVAKLEAMVASHQRHKEERKCLEASLKQLERQGNERRKLRSHQVDSREPSDVSSSTELN